MLRFEKVINSGTTSLILVTTISKIFLYRHLILRCFEKFDSESCFFSYVYWGEYPLTFAACLGQEESFRLMLAKGADPNAQDTNGNTVLHLLVIYEKLVRIVIQAIENIKLKYNKAT